VQDLASMSAIWSSKADMIVWTEAELELALKWKLGRRNAGGFGRGKADRGGESEVLCSVEKVVRGLLEYHALALEALRVREEAPLPDFPEGSAEVLRRRFLGPPDGVDIDSSSSSVRGRGLNLLTFFLAGLLVGVFLSAGFFLSADFLEDILGDLAETCFLVFFGVVCVLGFGFDFLGSGGGLSSSSVSSASEDLSSSEEEEEASKCLCKFGWMRTAAFCSCIRVLVALIIGFW
jgi:hypothetical protein